MFVLSKYIYYFILFYIRKAIFTKTNPKKRSNKKKKNHITEYSVIWFVCHSKQFRNSLLNNDINEISVKNRIISHLIFDMEIY
jgi:hypothetical protein